MTNYPKDMTDDLLDAVRDLPKVSPYLHVPAQSGSNRMLKRMKRGYTVEEYREMLARIRETIPDAAVTSDFIVGFCGETDEDFQATVDLVRECAVQEQLHLQVQRAARHEGGRAVSRRRAGEVKRRRNNELLAMQNAISEEDNQPFFGRAVEVLVEGPSKTSQKQRRRRPDGCN